MEITVNGRKYVLESYDHEAQTIINDMSYDAVPGGDTKTKVGSLQSWTVYFSLSDWEIMDSPNGKKVPITPKLDSDGNYRHTRTNFMKFMPKEDMEPLFLAAAKLNSLKTTEKKT